MVINHVFSILYDPHNDSSASQNMYFIFLFFLYVLVPHDIIFLIIFLYVNIYPILFLRGFPTHHPPFLRNIYSSAHELFIIISLCFFLKKGFLYLYCIYPCVFLYIKDPRIPRILMLMKYASILQKNIYTYIYMYIYIFSSKNRMSIYLDQ